MRSRRWPPAHRRRNSTARRVRRRRESHGLVVAVAVGAADALAVGGKRPGEPAAEHILERLGVDRLPCGGSPWRAARAAPSSGSADGLEFVLRQRPRKLRSCLSCSQARREREHTVCFLRGGSPRSPSTLRAANALPRNPGERGGRRRYRSACDSSRRAAQRKSPCHGGRCSARGQTPWSGSVHASPPPCARKTRRIAERLRHLVAVGPIVGQPPRRKKEGNCPGLLPAISHGLWTEASGLLPRTRRRAAGDFRGAVSGSAAWDRDAPGFRGHSSVAFGLLR